MRRTSTKRSAEAQEKLCKLVGEYLLARGAKPAPILRDGEARWEIDTKLGKLTVIGCEPIYDESGKLHWASDYLTVYGRFDDPEPAVKHFGSFAVNQYSGKWNLHHGEVSQGAKPEDTFEVWRKRIESIL